MELRKPVSCIAACALASGVGCSSSYMPRPGPRVAMIQQGGTPAYVRDGRVYEGGVFGGDLIDAVRGNPEAESQARTYKNEMVGGFLATVAGGLSMISGVTLLAMSTSPSTTDGGHNSTETSAGGLLLAGGVGAYITGLVLMLSAQPHMWDAINVYNDGVPVGPYAYPPAGSYAYPPPSSGWWPPQSSRIVAPPPTAPAPVPSASAPVAPAPSGH